MNKRMIRFNSPVILIFVFICFLSLIINLITGGSSNRWLFSIYRSSFLDPLFYWRLISHVFGHSGWRHFSGNMMYILLLGPLLEEKYGSWNIAVIFFLTALVTGIIHVLFFPYGLLGASGIVFALIILSSITSVQNRTIPLTFIIVVIIYLGGQISDGLLIRDNISNMTHIIGGIVGAGCGYALNYKK